MPIVLMRWLAKRKDGQASEQLGNHVSGQFFFASLTAPFSNASRYVAADFFAIAPALRNGGSAL